MCPRTSANTGSWEISKSESGQPVSPLNLFFKHENKPNRQDNFSHSSLSSLVGSFSTLHSRSNIIVARDSES